jgi:hypothetical protein
VEKTASRVEKGYDGVWEEWVNDLDGRDILEDVLIHVPEAAGARDRVDAADRRFHEHVRVIEECAWGDPVAARHGWTPGREWWYWTWPSDWPPPHGAA